MLRTRATQNRHGFWTSPTCKHQPFAPLGEPPLPHPLQQEALASPRKPPPGSGGGGNSGAAGLPHREGALAQGVNDGMSRIRPHTVTPGDSAATSMTTPAKSVGPVVESEGSASVDSEKSGGESHSATGMVPARSGGRKASPALFPPRSEDLPSEKAAVEGMELGVVESTDVTRDEAEGSSNAAEGSKGEEEKDGMCKKPVEATGGAQAGDSSADIASSSESNNVEDGEGEVGGDAPSEPSEAAASETPPPQSELDGGGRDPLAGVFGGLHPDNPAIDPPPSVGDTTNDPTLAKALLSPAPAPVLDPAPALTLASPFGDAGPVANGLVPAAHKGDGSGLGSGADAIDAFWSSTIVGGGGQLDSSTAVAESTGGGVGCALFRDIKLVSLMWRLHCSRFGLAACLASVLSCPLPSTVVAAMFFSARCGGFVFTCLARASRETNRPPSPPLHLRNK